MNDSLDISYYISICVGIPFDSVLNCLGLEPKPDFRGCRCDRQHRPSTDFEFCPHCGDRLFEEVENRSQPHDMFDGIHIHDPPTQGDREAVADAINEWIESYHRADPVDASISVHHAVIDDRVSRPLLGYEVECATDRLSEGPVLADISNVSDPVYYRHMALFSSQLDLDVEPKTYFLLSIDD